MIPNHTVVGPASHCSLCALYWSNSRYRALVDHLDTAPPAREILPDVPCKFRREVISSLELVAAGVDPQRQHVRCKLGLGLAGIVCTCKECRPTCDGYVALDPHE